jgi:hypothetical protein
VSAAHSASSSSILRETMACGSGSMLDSVASLDHSRWAFEGVLINRKCSRLGENKAYLGSRWPS